MWESVVWALSMIGIFVLAAVIAKKGFPKECCGGEKDTCCCKDKDEKDKEL